MSNYYCACEHCDHYLHVLSEEAKDIIFTCPWCSEQTKPKPVAKIIFRKFTIEKIEPVEKFDESE